MKKACLWGLFLLLNAFALSGQNSTICPAPNPPGADNCADACIYCNLNGYTGQTAGYTAGTAPAYCSTAENEQWLGFKAGDTSILISITPSNCQQGNGIETALYSRCSLPPIACSAGQAGGGNTIRTLTATLTPGKDYYLLVDGYEGDQCSFTVSVSPAGAAAFPPVDSAGPIQGPVIVAPGSTNTYTIPPAAGATLYRWTGPAGAKINGLTPPVQLPAPGGNQVSVTFGDESGLLCVMPINPCDTGVGTCRSIAVGAFLPPACPSNDTPGADLCQDACVYCNFNGYTGTTSGYTGQTPLGFCGTIENEQWFGFIAGGAAATFTATPSNCTNGDGIQIALYPSCDGQPIACNGSAAGNGTTPVSITTQLTPGVSYYLLIDGWAGDQCDFTLHVVPPSAIQAPNVGVTGQIVGPATICPNATVTYAVPAVSGAGAYFWSAPAGWLINGQTPPVVLVGADGNVVQVTAGASTGPLCVQPLNSCHEGATRCKTITVAPIPPTNLPPITVCYEDAPYELPWGDLAPSSGKYCTTLTSYLGCDSVVCQQVIVKAPIVKNLAPQYRCAGDSVMVCGEVFTESGVYAVVCESYEGCDSIVNFSVFILEPVAQIIPGNLGCATPPLTLNSAPSPGPKLWKNINGQVIGTGNSVVINQSGLYILEVIATAGGVTCKDVDTVNIVFGSDAPGAFAVGGTLTCTQNTLQLNGSSPTPGALFTWTGPDGFISNLEDPLVSFPGQYTLVVTHPQTGCTSQAVAVVQIDQGTPQIINLSGGTLTCTTPVIQLQCIVNGQGLAFSWAGPNGFTSVEQNPLVNLPGHYAVTATDPANGCTTVAAIDVPADFQPASAAVTGGTLSCSNHEVQLSCTTDAIVPSFMWLGPNGFSSAEQNPVVTAPGKYDVIVTGANGCTNTASAEVLLDVQIPAVNVTGFTLTCTQPVATLSCTTSAAQPAFAWSGPQPVAPEQNPGVTSPGLYTVTVTDLSNGCTATGTAEVVADVQLPAVIIAPPGVLTCAQPTIVLEGGTTANQAVFHWTGPGGFSADTSVVTVGLPGTYLLTVTDTLNGCAGAMQVNVTQDITPPTVPVFGGETLTCAVTAIQLNAGPPSPGLDYTWIGPGIPSPSGPSPVVTEPGLYILVVTNTANGCNNTASALILQDTVSPTVAVQADPVTCADSLFIGVTDPGNYEFFWTGPNGFSSTLPGFWIEPNQIGVYNLTVTDPENGCTQSITVDEFTKNIAPPVIGMVTVTDDQHNAGVGAIDIEVLYNGTYSVAWYLDTVLISDQEDLSGLHAGMYSVVVTGDNDCSTSLIVVVADSTSAVTAPGADATWEVFPNPASNRLQLRYRGVDQPETGVSLLDVAGRIVFYQSARPVPQITLLLDHLPPGAYRLQIRTKDTTVWRPVVLQR